jgi:hypothetical protein
VQPGCTVMFQPNSWCLPIPSPFVVGCCTPGHSCIKNFYSLTGFTCRAVSQQMLDYSYEQKRGNCSNLVPVGEQCGGAGFDCYKHNTCDQFGPWVGFCCPNGFSCQPATKKFRKWTCQVDVQDQPPGKSSAISCSHVFDDSLGGMQQQHQSCGHDQPLEEAAAPSASLQPAGQALSPTSGWLTTGWPLLHGSQSCILMPGTRQDDASAISKQGSSGR